MNDDEEAERIANQIKIIAKQQLINLLKYREDNPNFIEFELRVNKNLNEIGKHILQEIIPIFYGDGYRGSAVEVDNEIVYKCQARARERDLITSFGSIELQRAIYEKVNSNETKSFFDERLDIESRRVSPLVHYWSELLGIAMSFDEAAKYLLNLRGIHISHQSNQSWTEQTGFLATQAHSERIKDIIPDDKGSIPEAQVSINLTASRTVYIETDGCHINTKNEWKECKTLVLFEIEKISDEKHRLKNKWYYSTMKDCNEMKRQLKYMIEKYCKDDDVRIVAVCDGASWIWKMIEELFPKDKLHSGIIEIIDWFHAKEKLVEIQKELFGESADGNFFLESCESYLIKGNIETIEQVLLQLKEKQKNIEDKEFIDKRLKYFMDNKCLMRYGKFKEQGLCIGSGAIESGNKYVIQKRLKQPGMKWDEENANYMAHLRADYINGDFEKHFHLTHNALIEEAGN
jgi:hypothetical protein